MKLWAQVNRLINGRLALLPPASVTLDGPLSISVPWFTSLGKGDHHGEIIGFKCTIFPFVFHKSNLFFGCLPFFSAFFWSDCHL